VPFKLITAMKVLCNGSDVRAWKNNYTVWNAIKTSRGEIQRWGSLQRLLNFQDF